MGQNRMKSQPLAQLRIIKKLRPEQPGALALARRFGDELVCVRHRLNPAGDHRITTVELVVNQAAIHRRDNSLIHVRIGYFEDELRSLMRQHGAQWVPAIKRWRMPRQIAYKLGLRERVES